MLERTGHGRLPGRLLLLDPDLGGKLGARLLDEGPGIAVRNDDELGGGQLAHRRGVGTAPKGSDPARVVG
jgi:hypothetical protein